MRPRSVELKLSHSQWANKNIVLGLTVLRVRVSLILFVLCNTVSSSPAPEQSLLPCLNHPAAFKMREAPQARLSCALYYISNMIAPLFGDFFGH